MGALASDRAAPKQLGVRLHVLGELGPAPGKRGLGVRMHGT